jgi:hypothetical protein
MPISNSGDFAGLIQVDRLRRAIVHVQRARPDSLIGVEMHKSLPWKCGVNERRK